MAPTENYNTGRIPEAAAPKLARCFDALGGGIMAGRHPESEWQDIDDGSQTRE
jgi:hypothetical protein